jgi:hypothetical protein
LRVLFFIALCGVVSSSNANAQRIFDEWPVRSGAGPDALLRGVEAVYWNPASISTHTYRGEVFVADQRTPDVVGVGGLAIAGAWRLDARTTVGAGYQHFGIDDIGETSESPLPDEGISPTFSIAEDQLHFGAAHQLSDVLHAGAGFRYDRSNESGVHEATTSLVTGFVLSPKLGALENYAPALGGTLLAREGGVRWSGGVDFALPPLTDIASRLGYGVRGGDGMPGVEHRVGLTATWRQMLTAAVGAMSASAGDGRTWEATLGASLRVNRYELGVLRESLSNDFGAAYSFRLRFGIN